MMLIIYDKSNDTVRCVRNITHGHPDLATINKKDVVSICYSYTPNLFCKKYENNKLYDLDDTVINIIDQIVNDPPQAVLYINHKSDEIRLICKAVIKGLI